MANALPRYTEKRQRVLLANIPDGDETQMKMVAALVDPLTTLLIDNHRVDLYSSNDFKVGVSVSELSNHSDYLAELFDCGLSYGQKDVKQWVKAVLEKDDMKAIVLRIAAKNNLSLERLASKLAYQIRCEMSHYRLKYDQYVPIVSYKGNAHRTS